MVFEIKVPHMAESVFEATVGQWFKKEGDVVAAGDAVLELETDKVNVEVTAGQSGKIDKLVRTTGEIVRPGDVLAVIGEGTGALPVPAQSAHASQLVPAAPKPAPDVRPAHLPPAATVDATPVARRIAESAGLDISKVHGTGPGGRVTREDVDAHQASQALPDASSLPLSPIAGKPVSAAHDGSQSVASASGGPAPHGAREERVKLSPRRLTIARRLTEVNQQAVMTTTFNEVDMTGIADLRRRHREEFKVRHGVDLGLMSFFVKAAVAGLEAHPVLNAEIQGDELVYKHYYDMGIAVAADEGLLVPIVRDADRKSFAQIEKDILALAGKARERKLTLEELRGGTFTITNGGIFGSMMSTPILNPPQVGILGMHRIVERPVAVGGQVVIRPIMYLAVTYDHRVVEGADAVRFLVRVKQLLEDPGRLLVHA